MRVLVTGAEGFVGAHLCPRLASAGCGVRALSRRDHGDLARDVRWSALLEGVDAVVHLANVAHRAADAATLEAVNVRATGCLARAAQDAGVTRFVYLSSAKVYGEDSGAAAYAESSPLAPRDTYGRSKLAAEQALHAAYAGPGCVVLRPPLVYGPGVKANFLALLRAVERGVPLPLASIRNRRSLLYVGNLADAILACLQAPPVRARTWNLSDGPAVSTPGLVRAMAAALGRPARLLPFPPALLEFTAALAGRGASAQSLTRSLELDDGAIRRELGWQPAHDLHAGLRATVAWHVRGAATGGG